MAHKSTPDSKANGGKKIRIDKWLWAARFYKTRSLASEAIKGGKVSVNSHRAKPSREVELGDTLVLRQGFDEKTVIVQALSDKRGPATVAQQLYQRRQTVFRNVKKKKNCANLLRCSGHMEKGGRPNVRDDRYIGLHGRSHDREQGW